MAVAVGAPVLVPASAQQHRDDHGDSTDRELGPRGVVAGGVIEAEMLVDDRTWQTWIGGHAVFDHVAWIDRRTPRRMPRCSPGLVPVVDPWADGVFRPRPFVRGLGRGLGRPACGQRGAVEGADVRGCHVLARAVFAAALSRDALRTATGISIPLVVCL